MVRAASLDGGVRKELMPADTDARFSNGRLRFGRNGKLMAQRFDPESLTLSGEATVIGDELMYASPGAFSVSDNGLLTYRRGASASAASKLAWYDRSGHETGTLAPVGQYWDLSLSRDGRKVLVQVTEPQQTGHIWSFDVTRGVGTLLTPPETPNRRRKGPFGIRPNGIDE